MRWLVKNKFDNVEVGDIRTITKFLIIPRCIEKEWRWLEKASYQQICILELNYRSMDYGKHKEWKTLNWCDMSGREHSNVGKIGYSPYFQSEFIVTRFIDDNNWNFRLLDSTLSNEREYESNTPLSYFKDI